MKTQLRKTAEQMFNGVQSLLVKLEDNAKREIRLEKELGASCEAFYLMYSELEEVEKPLFTDNFEDSEQLLERGKVIVLEKQRLAEEKQRLEEEKQKELEEKQRLAEEKANLEVVK